MFLSDNIKLPAWVLGVIFLGGIVSTGAAAVLWNQHQKNQLLGEINEANARAEFYSLRYRGAVNAWQDLGKQVLNDEQIIERLRQGNEALAEDLEDANARILSLTETNVELRAELDSSHTEAEHTGENEVTVNLDESVQFRGGGSISVRGPVVVEITEPSAVATLTAQGQFPLTIVISRTPEGDLRVNADTGDPRLEVSRLDVTANIQPPASEISTGFFGEFADQLTGLSPWVNRGLGFAACLATR